MRTIIPFLPAMPGLAESSSPARRLLKGFLLYCAPLALVGGIGSPAFGQPTIYISPDVPTNPDGVDLLPWQVVEHVHLSGAPYTLEFAIPGEPAIDALHKMDMGDHWLFSIEAPSGFAGAMIPAAEPRDVILFDLSGPTLSPFFDGSGVTGVVPISSSIDALYLDPDDDGDLFVSFDLPTTIDGMTFQPSELVHYARTGALPTGWTLVGSLIDFALSLGTYFPSSGNVTGADFAGGGWVLALDIPTDLGPPGVVTYTPGEIVSSTGGSVAPFDNLQIEGAPGWPVSSLVDALSCQSNPGRINSPTDQITMDKAARPDIEVICPASCSSGAEEYGLYQGTIASINPGGVYDHVMHTCNVPCPTTFVFIPAAASSYYLLVPRNTKEEGSYCTDSGGVQRPQPALVADRCVEFQNITDCP